MLEPQKFAGIGPRLAVHGYHKKQSQRGAQNLGYRITRVVGRESVQHRLPSGNVRVVREGIVRKPRAEIVANCRRVELLQMDNRRVP